MQSAISLSSAQHIFPKGVKVTPNFGKHSEEICIQVEKDALLEAYALVFLSANGDKAQFTGEIDP